MVYSLLFRFGKNSQLLINRAHFSWTVQTSALHLYSPVFLPLHTAPKPALSSIQQHGALCGKERSLHVGSFCRMRDQREKKVSVSTRDPSSGLSAAQKVKQAGTDVTYLIVVLVGLGVTGGLLYVIFQELFSSSSPSKLYGKAFNKCRSHPEVIGAFGEPIKGYGETSRRGRRQQISHVEYMKDGEKHMRMKFYIEGSEPGLCGTVHSDSRENPETGKYEFRYIFVDVDAYPRRTIVIEDNR